MANKSIGFLSVSCPGSVQIPQNDDISMQISVQSFSSRCLVNVSDDMSKDLKVKMSK